MNVGKTQDEKEDVGALAVYSKSDGSLDRPAKGRASVASRQGDPCRRDHVRHRSGGYYSGLHSVHRASRRLVPACDFDTEAAESRRPKGGTGSLEGSA